jgi:hypothetical protein
MWPKYGEVVAVEDYFGFEFLLGYFDIKRGGCTV